MNQRRNEKAGMHKTMGIASVLTADTSMKRSFFPLVICVIYCIRVQAFSRPAFSLADTRVVLPGGQRRTRSFLFKNPREESNGKQKVQEKTLEFHLHTSINDISPVEWNACLTESSSPFLCHSWLGCLEESKCACAETGWLPQHVSISFDKEIVGVVPLYIKGHSMGEFIFDHQFAEAAYQSGINYYPKLLVAVPFTPVTGKRILWHPEKVLQACSREEITKLNRAVADFLKQIAISNNYSSVHVNFLTDEEATDLTGPVKNRSLRPENEGIQEKIRIFFRGVDVKDEYLRRTSVQYHWTNSDPNRNGQPFKSFGDYLNCFKSKKRINIRRERRRVLEDEKVKIDVVAGKDILKYDGLVKRMFDIYLSTIDKLIWGRQYLKLEFFEMLSASDFVDNLVFVCARQGVRERKFRAEDVFAGTFNIVKDGVFYGRYWGCLLGREIKNLHFECCYWSAIEYCIKNRLKRMEPGAGGGDYKWARGFDPVLIHSVHYICHPVLRRAIGQFFVDETEGNLELTKYLRERSAIGSRVPTK